MLEYGFTPQGVPYGARIVTKRVLPAKACGYMGHVKTVRVSLGIAELEDDARADQKDSL